MGMLENYDLTGLIFGYVTLSIGLVLSAVILYLVCRASKLQDAGLATSLKIMAAANIILYIDSIIQNAGISDLEGFILGMLALFISYTLVIVLIKRFYGTGWKKTFTVWAAFFVVDLIFTVAMELAMVIIAIMLGYDPLA